MDDDDLDNIDFMALDKLVEDHQAKAQVSQAAPVSPFGKAPYPGTAAQGAPPSIARLPSAALQHQQLQPQPQQQHWQRHAHPHQKPQRAPTAASSSYSRPQHSNVQVQQQPPGQYPSQRAGYNQPGMQHSRQQPPSQASMYSGPQPTAVSGPPVGRVSQAAAAAMGQRHQSQHQQQGVPSANPGVGSQQQVAQLQAERDALQQRLNEEQGTNAVLRSSLERKERERDDLQRRMQQASSQPSGLSSFNMAEAQKQVATLTQQLAFKEEEIQDLKRRCAQKDQAVRPLEQQVQQLQQDRQRAEQELEEANRDRRERGAGASTSHDPNPALPRMHSPTPSRVRQPASGAASGAKSSKTTGVKRKLSNVLGSPTGISGATPGGGPLQNGHAPLPLQSVVNGQMSSRDILEVPPRNSGVAQSNGVAQTGPPPAPPAPQPWYETPTWSPQPHRPRSTSSTLQQLWLTCPHSFSQLLTPWASSGLRAQSNSSSNPTNQLNQQESVASTKLVSALQQHIQMLACGDSSATVGMLQDLTAFLEVYHMPRSAVHELPGAAASAAAAGAAASQRTLSQGLSHPAGSADSMQPQAAAEAASEVAVSAALQVVSVLVAHDKACQQAVVQPLGPHPDPTKTHTQEGMARTIASLNLADLQLSERLVIKLADDGGKTGAILPVRPQFSPSHPSSKPPTHPPLSEVLLKLLSIPMTPPGMVQRALECYNVMAAITPALHRSAFAGIFTSGVLERLLSQAQHAQQALRILHSLVQSLRVCEMLTDGLAEGCQPDSITATVHSQDNDKASPHQQQPQQQVSGHSAEDPMEIDTDELPPNHKWTGTSELLESLLACLHIPTPSDTPSHTTPGTPSLTPQAAPATIHPPLTAPGLSPPAEPNRAVNTQWGVYKTQRLALLVIATMLQQRQQRHCRLLLRLVQVGQRNSHGGLCQCLLELVDCVTRDDSGGLLSAFTPVSNPGGLGGPTPRHLPSHAAKGSAAPPSALHSVANGPAARGVAGSSSVKAVAAPSKGGAVASAAHGSLNSPDSASTQGLSESHRPDKDEWYEHLRLAQEVLTLLRHILTDSLLGHAGIEDLVSSSSAIRLSLITTSRLSHWPLSDYCTSQSGSLPLPLQQWVTAWGSSSSSSTKIINSHADCRGGLTCSSVEDVAYMAKSIRQRVLVQLNHMAT
ncbi:hypothetical protein ABBQ32_002782 [Trebouxia sp. C0010 RCD-2024]